MTLECVEKLKGKPFHTYLIQVTATLVTARDPGFLVTAKVIKSEYLGHGYLAQTEICRD